MSVLGTRPVDVVGARRTPAVLAAGSTSSTGTTSISRARVVAT